MSRISDGRLEQMKSEILKDLYTAIEKRLADRAVEIAGNSRQCWISPYEPILNQLPNDLIAKCEDYRVNIQYPWNRAFSKKEDLNTSHVPRFADNNWENIDYIQEKWLFKSPTPIVNPLVFGGYGNTNADPQELHTDMYKDAEILCKEKIKLIREKSRMQNYLQTLIAKNRTHKQLREVLPSSFHRYLPPETIKRKAIKKEARHVEVPDFLGERQTINLLEDN
jgi:hypothetical protein